MTADEGRQSSSQPVDARAGYAPIWRNLDRNVPLAAKLAAPIIVITLLGTILFGFIVVGQATRATEAGYIADANAAADGAATEFAQASDRPQDMTVHLNDLVADEPNIIGIWILDLFTPGAPVVASNLPQDIGRIGLISPQEIMAAVHGQQVDTIETSQGKPVLESIQPVSGGRFAVVTLTSLVNESRLNTQTILWIAAAGFVVGLLELGGLALILKWGVMRRIRRVQAAVTSYGGSRHHLQLSEGDEPAGHDLLFNLARDIDHKLGELEDHERAGDIISDLGIAAMQGAMPDELTSRALSLVQRSAGLDRCFLVDALGAEVVVASSDQPTRQTSAAALPIWLGALVRAAARARRPVLADSLGEGCTFWDAHERTRDAAAAFVPLAGNPNPIGVMVGLAKPGGRINATVVNLMEGVATTLGETLQRNAASKAQQESEVKSKALSTVSHEMRNPLNAMLGFSEMLLSGTAGPLNEKQEEYMRRVDGASKHLLSLVNEYLDLARIMAGSLPMEIGPVAVETEVKNVLELLGPGATEKRVTLHSMVAPGVVAQVDRLRLRQILVNLVSNAVKFTPAGGHVRVEVAGGSNGVRISVIDTGIGIPADRQHLVFTEFSQLHSGDSANGSGLGLMLTKRFVEAMGGFIRFTSAEGAGTIFDVWLPGENSPHTAAQVAAAAIA